MIRTLLTAAIASFAFVAPAFSETILVRSPTAGIIKFESEVTETVASLKAQIEAKQGIPSARQELIFAGKVMENDRSLADYGVENESTLFLVLRLQAD